MRKKLSVFESEEAEFIFLAKKHRLYPRKYICLFPGSQPDVKLERSPNNFALIGDYFAEKGYKIVLLGGTQDKKNVKNMKKMMASKSVNLAGKISLGTLTELIRNSALLITCENGMDHIAAAVNAKSITISQNKKPQGINEELNIMMGIEESGNPLGIIEAASKILEEKDFFQMELIQRPRSFYKN